MYRILAGHHGGDQAVHTGPQARIIEVGVEEVPVDPVVGEHARADGVSQPDDPVRAAEPTAGSGRFDPGRSGAGVGPVARARARARLHARGGRRGRRVLAARRAHRRLIEGTAGLTGARAGRAVRGARGILCRVAGRAECEETEDARSVSMMHWEASGGQWKQGAGQSRGSPMFEDLDARRAGQRTTCTALQCVHSRRRGNHVQSARGARPDAITTSAWPPAASRRSAHSSMTSVYTQRRPGGRVAATRGMAAVAGVGSRGSISC